MNEQSARLLAGLWGLGPLDEVLPAQREAVEDEFRRHPKFAEAPRNALADAMEPLLAHLRRRRQEFGQNGYLRGPHWERIKAVTKYLADGRCQMCHEEAFLQTHHHGIDTGFAKWRGRYARVGIERLADVWVLCSKCHEARERKDGTWKEREPDPDTYRDVDIPF